MQQLRVKLWVASERGDFGAGHIQIMRQIARTGSIMAASKHMGLSYKKTWSKKAQIEEILGGDIFNSQVGRSARAGTTLSEKAEQIASAFEQLEREVNAFAQQRFAELLSHKLSNSKQKKENQ